MTNLDGTWLLLSIVFSCIGIVYYAYGKRNPYFKFAGVLLFLFSYFINTVWILLVVGVLILALPFILDRIYPID